MSTADRMATRIGQIEIPAIRKLQEVCHEGSRIQGFHREGDALREPFEPEFVGQQLEWDQSDVRALRNHYANKLMLIVGEASEAHEELRKGRAMDETYYPSVNTDLSLVAVRDGIYKPEGIPSELADIVIRVFDLAEEAHIDLAAMIVEKLTFNSTRPAMHGKNF